MNMVKRWKLSQSIKREGDTKGGSDSEECPDTISEERGINRGKNFWRQDGRNLAAAKSPSGSPSSAIRR